MKKSSTSKSHFEQINLALAHIHYNFGSPLNAEDLSNISGYSIFHFHRIFKEVTGENINDYIRNTRLEKASNLLLYNQHQTIEMIAINSGFATAAGFRTAFKKRFNLTPKQWRKVGYEKNSVLNISNQSDNVEISNPSIVKNEAIPMIYMMDYGYKNDMSLVWNQMHEWCEAMNVLESNHRFIGLFHNHPSTKKYEKARYLACVETNSDVYRSGKVGKCLISGGKFAKFEFKCTHSELYKLMHMAYIKWLPSSNYEIRNFPAYVEYKNPDNLLLNKELEVDFYMPIQLII